METGRVEKEQVEPRGAPRRDRFGELLKRTMKRPAGSRPPRARATESRRPVLQHRSAQVSGEGRRTARSQMDARASARLETGAQASAQATRRLEERARAMLAEAIERDPHRLDAHRTAAASTSSSPPSGAAQVNCTDSAVGDGTGATLGATALPSERTAATLETSGRRGAEAAERAMELVEQVETFLRSGKPALSLTLRGTMAGRVEVQRVAPGTVSLHFESKRPPAASELAVMRSELQRGGLTVRAMDVVSVTSRGD